MWCVVVLVCYEMDGQCCGFVVGQYVYQVVIGYGSVYVDVGCLYDVYVGECGYFVGVGVVDVDLCWQVEVVCVFVGVDLVEVWVVVGLGLVVVYQFMVLGQQVVWCGWYVVCSQVGWIGEVYYVQLVDGLGDQYGVVYGVYVQYVVEVFFYQVYVLVGVVQFDLQCWVGGQEGWQCGQYQVQCQVYWEVDVQLVVELLVLLEQGFDFVGVGQQCVGVFGQQFVVWGQVDMLCCVLEKLCVELCFQFVYYLVDLVFGQIQFVGCVVEVGKFGYLEEYVQCGKVEIGSYLEYSYFK